MLRSLLPEKRIRGNPLESHLRTFAASLLESGYRKRTIQGKLYLLSGLGWWFGRNKRVVSQLDEHLVKVFAKHKRRMHRADLTTLQQFVDHLRELNVIPHRKLVSEQSRLADVLNAYGQHLRPERGLIPGTIREYQSYARNFLVELLQERRPALKAIKARDIFDFVLRHCRSLSIKRAQLMTTAFRSFFRFLFQKGEIGTDLAASVPRVPDWRQSTVPKYLTAEEVQRVLGACNRQTPSGRRDYAILLLLARLGLRAGEVVSLQLDDIDWRAGELLVRGKGLRRDRMPLPDDVGKALASYLRRDRPVCQTRRVFVRMNAPHRGFAACATLPTIVRVAQPVQSWTNEGGTTVAIIDKLSLGWHWHAVTASTLTERSNLTFDSVRSCLLFAGHTCIKPSSNRSHRNLRREGERTHGYDQEQTDL